MSQAENKDMAKKKIYPDSEENMMPGLSLAIKEFSFREVQTFSLMPLLLNHFFWIRVMEGEICFMVDGECVYVSATETLFINSRHFNRFSNVIKAPARLRVIAALPDAVKVPVLDEKIRRMVSDDSFPFTVIRPVSDLFSYDLDAIFDLDAARPDEYEFEVAANYLRMLRQIYRVYHHTNPNETITRNSDLHQLREMLGFIGERYRDEITVDQIAAAGRMSRSRCTRLFRQYLQESPIEHVQKYRLQRSVYLVNNTDLQFSEIAGKCGFNQQSYFNRLFVRQYGITPGQMRAEAVKNRGSVKTEPAENEN